MIRKITSLTIVLSLIIMQFLISPLPAGNGERGRGDGNESFETATEISTDGTPYNGTVVFDTDFIDYLEFSIIPNPGACVNATVNISAITVDAILWVGIYTPDEFIIYLGGVVGGGPDLSYSFWAPTEDYYYLHIATMDVVNADYQVTVETQDVAHPPDGNNNITEATEVAEGNVYRDRVNKTTDLYDIYKVYVNSNATFGDGLEVHLDNFIDVYLVVYDPEKRERGDSDTLMSSDPDKGETVRFVVNQTGYYYIMAAYEYFWPDGDHAEYNLTVNITPNQPHDEDWSMDFATETTLGIHEGRFESTFDEYDYYVIDLEEGDELNVSVMAPDIEGWDMDIDIESWDLLDFDTDSGGSTQYRRTGCKIPEDGTYYIGIQNEEFGISNYTFLITIDGTHFGNVRPVTLNQSFDDLALVEDTSDTYDLNDVFNTKGQRTFSSPSHDTRNGMNLAVNISQAGIATITPAGNWSGNETVTFRCNDYFNKTAEFILNVSVTPVNDAPFFADIAGTPMPALFWIYAVENEWNNFTVNVTDADNSTEELNVSVTSGSSNLFYSEGDGLFHYFTDNDSVESEIFTVTVSDNITSSTQDINVDITGMNDPPIAKPIRLVSGGNGSLTVTLSTDPAYDEEGDALSYLWIFGDGDNMMDLDLHTVTHTYEAPGYYLVQLVVDDSELNDTVSLEIAVTMGDAPDEPQWFYSLDDEPVGTNTSLEINITSATVRDVVVAKSFLTSTIESTYDITGTCGDDVDIVYLYYGTEQLSYIRWKPIDEGKAIVTPSDGTWSLKVTVEMNLTLFSGVDWMGILAIGWCGDGYNVDTRDAEYTYEELDDGGEIDPSLWKNMTKSYTDDEKDEMYRHMKITSIDFYSDEMEAEPIFATFGERPDLDIIKLSSRLEGSTFHVDLTTRGPPTEPDPDISLDLDDPDTTEEWLLREEVAYYVYLVSPDFNESGYTVEDVLYGQSTDEIDSVLDFVFLGYPLGFIGIPEIEGNTISWEVSLDTLTMWGLEPSTDFELFAFAYLQQTVEVYEEFASGYDSAGYGAFSPDTSTGFGGGNGGGGGGGGEGLGSSMGTVAIVLGGIGAVLIIAIIIVVIVVIKKKGPKEDTNPVNQFPQIVILSREERTNKLIGEAEGLGIDVSGYRDDMDRAITYLKEDEVQLKGSLDNISLRLQSEIDRKKGIEPPPIPPDGTASLLEGSPDGAGVGETGGDINRADQQPPGEFQPPVEERLAAPLQPPICPTCGQVANYYPEYECYWCDMCQNYVNSEEPQAAPPVAPNQQGTAASQGGQGVQDAEWGERNELDSAFDF